MERAVVEALSQSWRVSESAAALWNRLRSINPLSAGKTSRITRSTDGRCRTIGVMLRLSGAKARILERHDRDLDCGTKDDLGGTPRRQIKRLRYRKHGATVGGLINTSVSGSCEKDDTSSAAPALFEESRARIVNSALRKQTAKAQRAKEGREQKMQVFYCASTLKLISSTPNPAQLSAACFVGMRVGYSQIRLRAAP
jgi:hypothetical protein